MAANLSAGHGRAPRLDAALRIAAVVSVLALMVVLTFVPPSANDFWLQARIGQLIVETGEIPRTVLFAFTEARNNFFNVHEWLPSVAFHLFDKALGYDRLVFVQGLFGLAVFGLSTSLAWRLTQSLGASLLLGAGAVIVANYRYHLRPELFALVLLLLLLHVLVGYQVHRRWKRLLWAAPIAVVWANSHGSFLLGPIVAGLFATGEAAQAALESTATRRRRRLLEGARAGAPYAAVAVAMALVSIANPLGVSLLHFALTLSTSEVTKAYINEWNPTLTKSFVLTAPFGYFAAMLLATVALVVAGRRRVRFADILLLLAFGGLAFQRTRFVALFGFVAIVVCGHAIGTAMRQPSTERWLLAVATGLAICGLALAAKFGNAYGAYPFFAASHGFTEPMVQRLAEPQTRGNVFNSYELGAELIYRAWPRLKPSLDSRIDSYGDQYFLAQHRMLFDEALLRQFLADYDVRYMLLLWRDVEFIKKMEALRRDGWRLAFGDHKMVLLVRVDP